MDSTTELKRLLELLNIEKEAGLRQYNEALENQSIEERRKSGVTWYPLDIDEQGYGLGDYPWIIAERSAKHGGASRIRSGNMVEFFSANETNDDRPCRGTVNWVDKNRIKVTLFQNEAPDWIDDGKVGLNLLFDINSFSEMESAIKTVMNAERNRIAELREVLYGYKSPDIDQRHHDIEIPSLNASQNRAVNAILAANDVALVHGPPGTGKTTTIVQAVKQFAKTNKNILVTAPSNAAADLLTEKLAEQDLAVVRIGNLSRIDEAVTHHTLEYLLTNHKDYGTVRQYKRQAEEYRTMAGKYKRKFGKDEREQRKLLYREAREVGQEAVRTENHLIDAMLDNANVVIATLVGANHYYLREKHFQIAVIDEAAQAMEPAAWIPVLKADKIVFAGDPFQLPPTIISNEAAKQGLSQTLMEKAMQRLDVDVLLDTQYRMHEQIMGFSNQQFYEGALKAHETVATHALELPSGRNQPVEFVDTAGCGFDEKQNPETLSLVNQEEFAILLKHLEAMLEGADTIPSIGIISPYKEQVLYMRDAMRGHELAPNITINTVDAFQGQERDVIYLSMVRSNDRSEIGFLADYRRMNVAMTRARKKLVIVGDSATLGNDNFYAAFLEYCEGIGGYGSAWEWMG